MYCLSYASLLCYFSRVPHGNESARVSPPLTRAHSTHAHTNTRNTHTQTHAIHTQQVRVYGPEKRAAMVTLKPSAPGGERVAKVRAASALPAYIARARAAVPTACFLSLLLARLCL